MREILFRGKRTDDGEWAYGYYVAFPNGQHIIVGDSYCNYVYVQPETVGQYTGMKDATGKRIFEGDILADGNSIAAIAEYCTTMFRLRRVDNNYNMTWGATKHLKVIGNIYEMWFYKTTRDSCEKCNPDISYPWYDAKEKVVCVDVWTGKCYYVYCRAEDEARARKKAQDMIAQYKEEKEGIT